MTTRKMSGREGYKTGPVRFGKEDFRSGKVDEVRQKVQQEAIRRDPLLASGPDSPIPQPSMADLQSQLKEANSTIDRMRLQHTEELSRVAADVADRISNKTNREREDLKQQVIDADFVASRTKTLRKQIDRLSDGIASKDIEILSLKKQLAETTSVDDAKEIAGLKEELLQLEADVDEKDGEISLLTREVKQLQEDFTNKEGEISVLHTEMLELEETLEEYEASPTIPRAIRLMSIKSIKKVETGDDREDEFRVLAEVSSPTIPTAETQLRFPVSQLEVIQNAIKQ